MTTGEKISRLRKENNYTQEQLADLLGVSRQSISKYESGIAYSETEKLIRLSEMFGCTVDYLLKDTVTEPSGSQSIEKDAASTDESIVGLLSKRLNAFEKKSKRVVFGMPLWHVGRNAKGFIAVGLRARGVISIGLLSTGIISLGVLSIGVLGMGVFAAGLITVGSVALGGIAMGAISVGVVAVGAIAIGAFSAGALAIGQYIAIGDHASAMFAFGDAKATGSVFETVSTISPEEKVEVVAQMRQHIPKIFGFMVDLFAKWL